MRIESVRLEETIAKLLPELHHPPLLREMQLHITERFFEGGKVVVHYGDDLKEVPLIVHGLIRLIRVNEEGEERLLYFLGPGEICVSAFSCCMIQKRSEYKMEVMEDATLWMIPINAADRWLTQYHQWRNFIFSSYENKLMQLIDVIDSLTFLKLEERLLDYLYKLSVMAGKNLVRITHQEISRDLNVSREAVSRMLKKLERDGKLRLGRNKIELIDR